MEAMKNDGYFLIYVSERLKNDFEVVKTACNNFKYAFEFAGDKIKEQFSTPEALLNSEKKIVKDNQWSKRNEEKANAWNDKVNSNKANDLER